MGLFGKKKEEQKCCCGGACTPEKMAQAEAEKASDGVKCWDLAARNVMHWRRRPGQHWQS